MKAKKFATQIDEKTFDHLKDYSDESGRSISNIVDQALREYIQKVRIRPAFRSAMDDVLAENSELLKRLAK